MPQLELHAGIPTIRSSTLYRLPEIQLPPPGTRPEYYWDFGDGSTIDTLAPSVQHDYTTSLNPLIEHQDFDVSVTRNGYTVTRTLTFINLYAYLKRSRNRLHPPASASGYATRFRAGLRLSLLPRRAGRIYPLSSMAPVIPITYLTMYRPDLSARPPPIHRWSLTMGDI